MCGGLAQNANHLAKLTARSLKFQRRQRLNHPCRHSGGHTIIGHVLRHHGAGPNDGVGSEIDFGQHYGMCANLAKIADTALAQQRRAGTDFTKPAHLRIVVYPHSGVDKTAFADDRVFADEAEGHDVQAPTQLRTPADDSGRVHGVADCKAFVFKELCESVAVQWVAERRGELLHIGAKRPHRMGAVYDGPALKDEPAFRRVDVVEKQKIAVSGTQEHLQHFFGMTSGAGNQHISEILLTTCLQ